MLSFTRSMWINAGFRKVIAIRSGEEVIKGAFKVSLDMVICDWDMPGITGLEIVHTMRANEETIHLPFTMMTGEVIAVRVNEAAQAGVSDYIAKPIQPKMLIDKVTKLQQANKL